MPTLIRGESKQDVGMLNEPTTSTDLIIRNFSGGAVDAGDSMNNSDCDAAHITENMRSSVDGIFYDVFANSIPERLPVVREVLTMENAETE